MACGLIICAALIIIPLVIALLVRMKKPVRHYEDISGPSHYVLFGNWWKIWKKNVEFDDIINSTVYGNIYEIFEGNQSNLMISDPEIVRKILVEEKDSTCNSRASQVKESLSQSLLSITNELKENESTMKIKSLGLSQNLRNIVPGLKEACNRLRETLMKQNDDEDKFEITSTVSKFYDDIINSIVFGIPLTTTNENELHKFTSGIYDGKYFNGCFNTFLHTIPSLRYLDNLIATDSATRYFNELTKESLKRINEKEETSPNASLISLLANLKIDNKSLEEDEIQRECFSIVLASALLLKNSLIASIAILTTNEEYQERIRKEMIGQIHAEKILSYEAIENAKYLDMFVKEILRLYPADYRIERKCIKPIKLEKLEILENSKITFPIGAIHRLEKYYPEPEIFDPERFANDGGRRLLDSCAFLPYGQAAGDGNSLSIKFSLFTLKYVIAQLILNFHFDECENSKIHLECKKGSIIAKYLPMWVKLRAR